MPAVADDVQSDTASDFTATTTEDETIDSELDDPYQLSIDESDYDSEWEEEWQQTVSEIKFLFTGLLIPFVGRWFGRRFAFWLWTNYAEPWLGIKRVSRIAAVPV